MVATATTAFYLGSKSAKAKERKIYDRRYSIYIKELKTKEMHLNGVM